MLRNFLIGLQDMLGEIIDDYGLDRKAPPPAASAAYSSAAAPLLPADPGVLPEPLLSPDGRAALCANASALLQCVAADSEALRDMYSAQSGSSTPGGFFSRHLGRIGSLSKDVGGGDEAAAAAGSLLSAAATKAAAAAAAKVTAAPPPSFSAAVTPSALSPARPSGAAAANTASAAAASIAAALPEAAAAAPVVAAAAPSRPPESGALPLLSTPCHLVNVLRNKEGMLHLYASRLDFVCATDPAVSRSMPLGAINNVSQRPAGWGGGSVLVLALEGDKAPAVFGGMGDALLASLKQNISELCFANG
ncbi:hypothetical protein GPECTOR_81g226 [Gonium pectorale]|uniref:Uncharacterized protein n=1 Tax=Gonium pectorale TaxID=33097 RepID=A0A150G1M2_GONPE|nr:hypothetical protein GPECTOR_81g226 [Gonium pectorale]|eukprot:KXZ43776.1 hypothetical protein GPECTOR_81g226 [Gonium pectorale]